MKPSKALKAPDTKPFVLGRGRLLDANRPIYCGGWGSQSDKSSHAGLLAEEQSVLPSEKAVATSCNTEQGTSSN